MRTATMKDDLMENAFRRQQQTVGRYNRNIPGKAEFTKNDT